MAATSQPLSDGLPNGRSANSPPASPSKPKPSSPTRRTSRDRLLESLGGRVADVSDAAAAVGGLEEFARMPAQRAAAWHLNKSGDAPIVVGIAGGTGSGKTTVAAAIAERIGDEHLIHLQHDCYYRALPKEMSAEERAATNFDHPDSLETSLLCDHLRQLLSGQAVRVPTYDFASHQRLEGSELKEPARIILVEGILIYAHEELRQMLDIKIFVGVRPPDGPMAREERASGAAFSCAQFG